MAKTKEKKKVLKKVAKKKETAPKKVEKPYQLVVTLNDQVFKTETDDLQEAIQSFAPEFLKTKVVIQVKKGKKTVERVLYLQKGKVLFNNRFALEALVRNLIF